VYEYFLLFFLDFLFLFFLFFFFFSFVFLFFLFDNMTKKGSSAASSPSTALDNATGAGRFVCPMCSKVYRSGAGLRYHKRKRHRGRLVLSVKEFLNCYGLDFNRIWGMKCLQGSLSWFLFCFYLSNNLSDKVGIFIVSVFFRRGRHGRTYGTPSGEMSRTWLCISDVSYFWSSVMINYWKKLKFKRCFIYVVIIYQIITKNLNINVQKKKNLQVLQVKKTMKFLRISYQFLYFKDFTDWKSSFESRTGSKYVKNCGAKGKSDNQTTEYYYCNRTGPCELDRLKRNFSLKICNDSR